MIIAFCQLIFFALLIVGISKYMLVALLRKLAESFHLGPKAVGNIAGAATSVPELLTVSFSALGGFIGTSLYNIVSSNIINTVQYAFSIGSHKKGKYLRNTAIKTDLGMVALTILIPIACMVGKTDFGEEMIPALLLLCVLAYYIHYNVHKLHLPQKEETVTSTTTTAKNVQSIAIYSTLLILIGTVLYLLGEQCNRVLTELAVHFQISEAILGILLGIVTSLPELITFLEAQHQEENTGVIEATSNLLTSNLLNVCVIQTVGILLFHFTTS